MYAFGDHEAGRLRADTRIDHSSDAEYHMKRTFYGV